jgi:hypothetical protein
MGAGLLAQQPAGGEAKQGLTGKALIEARLAAARDVFEGQMKLWQNGRAELDDLPLWSRRWMDEEVRLAPDPAAWRAAIEAHLKRIQLIEAVADSMHKSARGTIVPVLKTRYDRLVAEEMLAEAKVAPRGLPTSK